MMDTEEKKALSEKRTSYVFMAANFCNNALSTMYFLKPERYSMNGTEWILSSLPMRFYALSLQYMFNAEYCKLSQRNDGIKGQNVASLQKLNTYHMNILGKEFEERYAANEVLIEKILSSPFCTGQRALRDSKFSHADKSQLNDFSIIPFTEEEMQTGFEHIAITLEIINNCHKVFGSEYFLLIPNTVIGMDTFVEQHTEYQNRYFEELEKHYGGQSK